MKNILFTLSTVAIMAIGVQAAEVSQEFEKIYSKTYKNLHKQNPEAAKLAYPKTKNTFITIGTAFGKIEGESGVEVEGYITHCFPTESKFSLSGGVKFSDHSGEFMGSAVFGTLKLDSSYSLTPGFVMSYLTFDKDNKTLDDYLLGFGATVMNTDTGIAVSASLSTGVEGDLSKVKIGYGVPISEFIGVDSGSAYFNLNYENTIVNSGDNQETITVGLSYTF